MCKIFELMKSVEKPEVKENKVVQMKISPLVRSNSMIDASTSQHRRGLIIPESDKRLLRSKNANVSSGSQYTSISEVLGDSSEQDEQKRNSSLYKDLCSNQLSNNSASNGSFESIEIGVECETIDFVSETQKPLTKTHHIINELLENEQKYVVALKEGIETYVAPFKSVQLPKTLEGKRFNIFSTIEQIRKFHETKLMPRLLESDHDPIKIADTFTYFIEEGCFDSYIVYVPNKEKSQKICMEHQDFFSQLDRDRLGINSFLLQPVQRLPRYRMLISELVKELFNNFPENKEAIIRCCLAERNIHNLLTTVNEQ